MRLPPAVSSRKAAWPSQVSVVSGIGVLSAGRRERNGGGPSYAGANLLGQMGSRLLPLSLALGVVLADATGFHRVAFYLALLAVVGAAAAAFDAVSRYLEGVGGAARAATTTL